MAKDLWRKQCEEREDFDREQRRNGWMVWLVIAAVVMFLFALSRH